MGEFTEDIDWHEPHEARCSLDGYWTAKGKKRIAIRTMEHTHLVNAMRWELRENGPTSKYHELLMERLSRVEKEANNA